jgi:hypothetical protein
MELVMRNQIANLAMVGLLLSLSLNHQALAAEEEESAKPAEDKVPESLAEFIGSSSPAFSLIGATDASVVRPETPQALAGSILNGLDEEGNLKSGLALEFSPVLLFAGRNYSLATYQKQSALARSFTNLQISAGFAKGTSDEDKSLRLSIGLVWTPINGMDVKAPGGRSACFDSIPLGQGGFDPNDPDNDEARRAKEKQIADCKSRFPLRRDNSTTLQFGVAPLFVSPDGDAKNLKSQGFAANGTLSIGLSNLFGSTPRNDANKSDENSSQNAKIARERAATAEKRTLFILSGFYRQKELVPDPANKGQFLRRDRWSLGTRLQFGLQNSSYFGLEAAIQRAKYDDGRRDTFKSVIGTYDFRLSKSLWLGLNLGTSFDKNIGRNSTFVGTKFRWSFVKTSDQGGLF